MNDNKRNNNLPWLLLMILVGVVVWALSTGNISVSLPNGTSTTSDTVTKTDNTTNLDRVIVIEQTNNQEVSQPSPIPEIIMVTATPEPLPTATPEPTPAPTAFPRPLEKWAYDWCVANACGNPGCDGVCQ